MSDRFESLEPAGLSILGYTPAGRHRVYGTINEIYRSELRRSLMVIPRGVFHTHVNIGSQDALLVSMPTRGFDHATPDVYRLPLDTEEIPYSFEELPGW